MRIEISKYAIALRNNIIRVTVDNQTFIPTQVKLHLDDPPMIAHVRKLFYGKPDTIDTAFAIAKVLSEPQYRDFDIKTDWGKECEVSNDGETWTKNQCMGLIHTENIHI